MGTSLLISSQLASSVETEMQLITVTSLICLALLSFATASDAAAAADDDGTVADNKNQRDRASKTGRPTAGRDVMPPGRKCARPEAPRQGFVRLRQRGKQARFGCVRGFRLYGSKKATCMNQTWSHPPPVCVAAGCGRIASSPVMTVTHHSRKFRDMVLNFTCLPGFRLVGRSTLYCDGQQWSSDWPDCIPQPSTTSPSTLRTSVTTDVSTLRTSVTTDVSTSGEQEDVDVVVTVSDVELTSSSSTSESRNVTTDAPAITLLVSSSVTPAAHSVQSSAQLQSGDVITTDVPPMNSTGDVRVSGSSQEQHGGGGGTLLWYAGVAGSCALLLMVVGAASGVAVRRRARKVKRYQLMDVADADAAAGAGDSNCNWSSPAVRYTRESTDLMSNCLVDSEQNVSASTQRLSSHPAAALFDSTTM